MDMSLKMTDKLIEEAVVKNEISAQKPALYTYIKEHGVAKTIEFLKAKKNATKDRHMRGFFENCLFYIEENNKNQSMITAFNALETKIRTTLDFTRIHGLEKTGKHYTHTKSFTRDDKAKTWKGDDNLRQLVGNNAELKAVLI